MSALDSLLLLLSFINLHFVRSPFLVCFHILITVKRSFIDLVTVSAYIAHLESNGCLTQGKLNYTATAYYDQQIVLLLTSR